MNSNFYLNKVYISNFKPFSYSVPLKEIDFFERVTNNIIQYTVLSGPNGYGKTSIFQAVEFILTGKVGIFEFKDKTRNYSDHVIINEVQKESIIVGEFLDKTNDNYISIVRYNQNVQPCTEGDCKEEYKDFKLYIINGKFEYSAFLEQIKEGKIGENSNEDLLSVLSERKMNEWVDSNYIKQEQSSNLLFKTNKQRVDFLDMFVEKSQEKYTQGLTQKLEKVTDSIKDTELKISELNKESTKKKEASIGVKPINTLIFKNENKAVWDKEVYQEGENFEQYINVIEQLESYIYNYDTYNMYTRISQLQVFIDRQLIFKIVAYVSSNRKIEEYIEQYERYCQLRKIKKQGVLESKLNDKIVSRKFINFINQIKEDKKIINQLSTQKDKLYTQVRALRDDVLNDEKTSKEMFEDICPLCGTPHKEDELYLRIKQYEEKFRSLKNVLSDSIINLNRRLKRKVDFAEMLLEAEIHKLYIEESIINVFEEIKDNLEETEGLRTKLEELLQKPIYDTDGKLESKEIEEAVDKIVQEVEILKQSLYQEYIEKEYDKIFDSETYNNTKEYITLLKKENIEEVINNLKIKKTYIDWCKRKEEYDKVIKNEDMLIEMSKKLKEEKILKRKIDKLIKAIKEGKDQYIEDITKYIEIPLYIYSGKVLQTHQSGLGVFCSTGVSTDKLTQFKLTTSANNAAHDIINKFSAGQKAALNIALILAFRKVKKNSLDILMIDDPCQSLDDINIASLVEILKNEFADTQIIMSTHDMDTAGYMCYKYYKASKTYNNYNVQKRLYALEEEEDKK